MDKAQIIAHSKTYMELLSQGVDPISKQSIADDSVLAQPRLKKCFAFVSEILAELLENNGFVALTPDAAEKYTIVEKKAAFSLSDEQIRNIYVSSKPVTVNMLLKCINRVVDVKRMDKLSVTSVNSWLVSNGYLIETKERAFINKTVRRPSDKSIEIGLMEQEVVDAATGEVKYQMVFTQQAQRYILNHLDEIVKSTSGEKTARNKYGY